MNSKRLIIGALAFAAAGLCMGMTNLDPAFQYVWGENIGWLNWHDANSGADDDNNMDQEDFGSLQACVSGTGRPAKDGCECFDGPEPSFPYTATTTWMAVTCGPSPTAQTAPPSRQIRPVTMPLPLGPSESKEGSIVSLTR